MSFNKKITYKCTACINGMVDVTHKHCKYCFGLNYSSLGIVCEYCNNTGLIPWSMKTFCSKCSGTGKLSY